MLKIISVFVLAVLVNVSCWSQEVTGSHDVKAGSLPNEFIIKTTITGLGGADLARIKYFISKEHIYKKSSNNGFFSKEENGYVKFYIMSIPANGAVEIELGVILSGEGVFEFPVEFQYSKNEEKIVFDCDPLKIENGAALVAEEPSLNEKIEVEAKKGEEELAAEKQEEERLAKIADEEKARKADEEAAFAVVLAAKAKEDADKLAKQEQLRVENEEAEQENLAKQTEEEAKKKAEANLLAEEQAKNEAAALALVEEQKKEKAEEERLAEAQKVAEEEKTALAAKEKEEVQRVVETPQPTTSEVKYGVQIFALAKYTEQKVKDFCKRNDLIYSKISTLQIKGITKIRYGSVNTKAEAEALKKELLSRPQINGGFVVKL